MPQARNAPALLLMPSEGYPPERADIADLFADELPRRQYRIDWLVQSRLPRRHAGVEPYGGGRAWVGRTVAGGRLAKIWNAVLDFRNDLRLFGLLGPSYDAVIVRDKIGAGLIAIVAAWWRRKLFVYWLSYPLPEGALTAGRERLSAWPWLSWLRGVTLRVLLYRVIIPAAGHTLVQSERMQRDLEARGIASGRMTPVPMGVPLRKLVLPYHVTRVRKPADETWIVYLGTLARVRGVDCLVGALALVRTRVPNAKLYLVGAGNNPADERHLQRRIESAGVAGAVVMTGHLERGHAWEYVAAADVCVSPLRDIPVLRAGSPTKLIEYLALARPVVASAQPEQDRVLRESGAGISVPHDEEAFAEAIVRIAGNRAEAQAMGRRGRAWVEAHRGYDTIGAFVDQRLRALIAAR
jgi:glycosyltransferase involved in cell wall biosynthesis